MHIRALLLASLATIALASPAFAVFGCVTIPTPNIAAVDHTRSDKSGVSNLNGTAWTKATYCPAGAAANNTCTGETLSERVPTTQFDWTTFDGDVADNHRKTFLGWPFGPVLPNPCP